jgi:uncharacterized protein involved in exopolysaccharide biosynthesis
MDMVKKYNLYAKERQKTPATSGIVELFRSNVLVELVQADVTDPVSGRAKRASIAFTVSFMDESPKTAQRVADELVTAFLSENVKTRTARATETRGFLKEEGDRFQKKVQQLERQIAEFKDRYSGSLPELFPYNLSMIERLQEELASNQNEILVLKDQITTMSLELASVPPYLYETTQQAGRNEPTSSEALLEQLRVGYNSLMGKYEPNHPDIVRLKRQIQGLEKELGISSSQTDQLQAELDVATTELNSLNQRYAENHPDIRAIKKKIESLEGQLEEAGANSPSAASQTAKSRRNPAYVQLSSRINSTENEVERLRSRQPEIRARLADFEKRVAETNQVQRAYDELTRDHANTLAKYRELRAKELEAELSQNLESENKGESFTLIEPPLVPTEAEKPNRPKLMVLGGIASVGSGMGFALLIEMLFGGVRGYTHITSVVGKAPLVVVPFITTTRDIARKKTIRNRWILFVIVLLTAAITAIHFYVINLEVLWFRVIREVSLL